MEASKFNIRETLAAGGLILSLVFVGIEIQQNTNAVKATAIMEYYSSSHDQFSMRANNPEIARIISIVFSDDADKLTQQEALMFSGFASAGFLSTQGAYRLWTMGVLPDEEWESAWQTTCPDSNSEKVRSTLQMIWNESKPLLLPSFVEALESACGFNKSN